MSLRTLSASRHLLLAALLLLGVIASGALAIAAVARDMRWQSAAAGCVAVAVGVFVGRIVKFNEQVAAPPSVADTRRQRYGIVVAAVAGVLATRLGSAPQFLIGAAGAGFFSATFIRMLRWRF